MAGRGLLTAARDSEDVASGLRSFRHALPEESSSITSLMSKLYEISALFTRLDSASQHPRYEPSFFRVQRGLSHVVLSSHFSNKMALDMFGRTKTFTLPRVWYDLKYRMGVEGVTFHERLDWYRALLVDCISTLKELPCPDSDVVHAKIIELLHAQQLVPVHSIQYPVDATPGHRYAEMPTSPSSDGQRPTYPWAPEPPPLSPTYTSSSSRTYDSSQTSAMAPVSTHWARDVFDGTYPATEFRRGHASRDGTRCEDDVMPDALERLHQDDFERALELQFENEAVWLRLYHRASDGRARVLYMASKTVMYCAPLTQLKIIRDKSCLKLCRVLLDGRFIRYRLWANLNFATFERMCLFYSTFVAMKRQDNSEKTNKALLEQDELGEEMPFGGRIRDEDLMHALKLFRDKASGVIRLEASPLRGPMAGVPLWTAFITTYKLQNDQDWAYHLGGGLVSLAALKPSPYIFLSEYKPPHRGKEWLLRFHDLKDAQDFITTWIGLCRRSD